jgi:hypothetical protein
MGFFSRNQPRESPPVVRPVVVQPSDLAGFSARLATVEQAVAEGATGRVYEAIRALSESVGGVDVKQLLGLTSGDGIQEELSAAMAVVRESVRALQMSRATTR